MGRIRRLLWIVGFTAACGPAAPGELEPAELETVSQGLGTYAALAGISGTVTTLATYNDGGTHPGVNSIDIGGSGTVWHQFDYLDSSISGGFVHAFAENTTPCSSEPPSSSRYNGQRIGVETYFFNSAKTYLGYHRETYQHVVPNSNVGKWFKWNKSGSSFWSSANVIYNNTTAGGLSLGSVFLVSSPIYGSSGQLCTSGTHLHQEGYNSRAPQRYVGEYVTARYSDMHTFSSLFSGCGNLNYQGTCVGQALLWCESSTVKFKDCAALGQSCQYQDATIGYVCK